MNRAEAVMLLRDEPYRFANKIGFDRLTELHNDWIRSMVLSKEDKTLQGHRGSYKTTCLAIALAIIMVLMPNKKTLFMRKTDNDVKEIVSQVKKILQSKYMRYFVSVIYNTELRLTVSTQSEITTNLTTDPRGTPQLVAIGINGSLTGKHFDIIFTDDIVNLQDRISKAEREHTKSIYMELQNIKNRGGRIYNTGTPWHKDDCFSIMPPAEKYDCYTTGLISKEEMAVLKHSMESSLFAANYELKHIASEDALFTNPKYISDMTVLYDGIAHIDAAYGGEDSTAFTVCKKVDGKFYIFGKKYHKHVDDCLDSILKLHETLRAGTIYNEKNADKGYLAKELRNRGVPVSTYSEKMNKYIKIASYLKKEWSNLFFVEGTDPEYIDEILDYSENAAHDDCPDSAASIIRQYENKTVLRTFAGGI